MSLSLLQVEKKCKKNLRLTKQLRIILSVIYHSDDHPNVDVIYERAYAVSKSISKATVYRSVRKLVENGIVAKQDFGLGKSHYEITKHHHHHLIDISTGKVIEFESKELEDLKEKVVRDLGFELVEHRLDMYVRPIKKKASKQLKNDDESPSK